MNLVTIPKKLVQKDDLVLISKKEYKALLALKKVREFTPTKAQKKALLEAEKELKLGKALSYNEFVRKLGFTD